MTYEKAIETCNMALRYIANKHSSLSNEDYLNHLKKSSDIGAMIDALEKQIPKKPKIQVRGVYDEDNGDWMYDQEWKMCPTCRKRNEVYIGWKYCPECGQKLDWSEVEQ